MNSNVKVIPYNLQLDSSNALSIISEYDVILDATDNAVTRYLINDACVLSKKPLVSAAALQLSGQFTVYNYPPRDPMSDDEQVIKFIESICLYMSNILSSSRLQSYEIFFFRLKTVLATGVCFQHQLHQKLWVHVHKMVF